MDIKIVHLYPDLLNLYGDRGNIQCMVMRCRWRGIDASVQEYTLADRVRFDDADIVLLGGGSDREQQILALVAEGKTNPQIAEALFLSPETIKWYRKKLLVKFDVPTSAALVSKAKDLGLV